jgi:hypothetical protein
MKLGPIDLFQDAQVVHQCLVLYVSPRQTHNLQLVIVPLISKDVEELKKRFLKLFFKKVTKHDPYRFFQSENR